MNRGIRRIIRRSVGLGTAFLLAGIALADLPPACWDKPRMLYLADSPGEWADRVHLARRPGRPGDRLVVDNPDSGRPGPWRAAIELQLVDGDTLLVGFDSVAGPIAPREIGASYLFLRVPWGRTRYSDLLIDRRDGRLVYHQHLIDGTDSWLQARESCALPAMADQPACDCRLDAEPWPRPRAKASEHSTIGLLVLPELFGPGETGGMIPADPVRPLLLYPAPEPDMEPVRTIRDYRELRWQEYSYEAGAAVVTGRHEGWFRIGLADGGSGWVRPAPPARFMALSELYRGAMTYLVNSWSGRLWNPDRGGWYADATGHDGETAVEVVAAETDGDTLWLEVIIPEHPPCGGDRQPPARGWIPAWNKGGELNVWFHSRGC